MVKSSGQKGFAPGTASTRHDVCARTGCRAKLFKIICLVQGCRLSAFTTCPTQTQIHRTTNELGSNPPRQLDGAATLRPLCSASQPVSLPLDLAAVTGRVISRLSARRSPLFLIVACPADSRIRSPDQQNAAALIIAVL